MESHVDALLQDVPPHCAVVTVNDGHPAALAWLGSVRGHRVAPLGVETFGQSGSIDDLYASLGFDVNGIIRTAEDISSGKPVRHRKHGAAA
jgi:pyruvate dehydrogenase E1 component